MDDLLELTKKSLSIVNTSTFKDDEIKLLINSGILDMKRQGINMDEIDDIRKFAIVMYVKGNFGMCDDSEKKISMSRYISTVENLSLSDEYKAVK